VEGLADLLAAETEAQRRQALRQFEGALGALYEGWRTRLVRALAYAEAEIDFSDEELPGDLTSLLRPDIAALADEIEAHLRDSGRGERLREGVTVVILGAPNAGKSSLLNALARRDVAIVSEEAGTTRDPIEVPLDLGGYPVVVVDTAGLREQAGAVESEGIRRARARAASADLKLVLFDALTGPNWDTESLALVDPDSIPVLTKTDLLPSGHLLRDGAPVLAGQPFERTSTVSGEGFPALLTRLGSEVEKRSGLGETPVLTRARHRVLLEQCLFHLHTFGRADADLPPELAAEELRLAARSLSRLTGRVDVEDLLDVIFRDFCIGK
jgi:tRNA modification GTPase